MEGFAACFAGLEDPRTNNAGRHDLLEILVIALSAVLCGRETAVDKAEFGRAKEEFLRRFLRLEHGIPSQDTFSRVFRHLDPEQFRACFIGFMARFAKVRTEAEDLEPLGLAFLASNAAELYEPVAEEKGIALGVDTEGPALIRGQPQLLAQAIANLLDNAVKHTPARGRITVMIGNSGKAVALAMADTGPGIPEADRARVLERFVRLEECRSTPGAGLGLSLVAAVAKLHDATVHLDDNNPGLKISVLFPADPEDDGVEGAAPGPDDRLD